MKNVSVASIVVLGLLATACSFSASSDGRPPAPPPGYAYAPQIMPAQVPRPAGPQPPLQVVPQAVGPGVAAFREPINIAQIQAIALRNPKACGFVEVAAGVWTRVDCHSYAPAQRAVPHLSPRKAAAVASHTTQWKPFRLFAGPMQQAFAQGFSTGIFQGAGSRRAANGAPAPIITGDAPPGTVDHRMMGLEGPIKDQGPVGACTAFSLSTVVDNAAIRAGKMLPNNGAQASSANHVWAAYGYPQMGTAADANKGRAIAPMSLWGQSHAESCKIANPIIGDCGDAVTPHVVAGTWRQDPLLVAKSNRADQGGAYRIAEIERIDLPVKTEQLVQVLATGADLWVAFKIDGFAWSNSKMSNGVIPDWTQDNGGHAVTMAGYRDGPGGKQFLIHNNWGTSWGDGGYGWVSEAMVQRWMNYAYQVKLEGGVAPSEVTDGDCSADSLVDFLSGRCMPICPDNSRAANGCAVPGQPLQPGQIPGFPAGIPSSFPAGMPSALPSGFPQIPGLPPIQMPTPPR
ncbi:MAG: hypothetical protein JWP97_91 [Labilithrix sp.]|nr:hypothetical protein [Labilithrix sp.]